jgi:hypothetical protein
LSELAPDTQAPVWIAYSRRLATPGFAAPEQTYPQHPNRIINESVNVYMIAACVYKFITGKYVPRTASTYGSKKRVKESIYPLSADT